MKTGNIIWGALLVIVGGMFLVNNIFDTNVFSMGNLWPIFVLATGLSFECSYFAYRKNPGLLVPGGIITTIGLLFFFETFTNWQFAGLTWPIYIFAVAVGLFQLYLFGGRKSGLLIPVGILTVISAISFTSMVFDALKSWNNFNAMIGMIIIVIGLFVIYQSFKKK